MAVLANEAIMKIVHLQKTQANPKKRPRRPLGPYLYYFIYARSKIASEHPGKRASELMRMVCEQWAQMSTEEKAPFIEINDMDVQRFSRQLAEFEKNGEFHDEEGNVVTYHGRDRPDFKAHKSSGKLTSDAKREHPEIKAKRGRPRKEKQLEIHKERETTQAEIQEPPEMMDKRVIPRLEQVEGSCVVRPIQLDDVEVPQNPVKAKRGRPRKVTQLKPVNEPITEKTQDLPVMKPKRGRPRKTVLNL
jgi:hypothetical protein